jgi:hypothetical protein
MRWSWAEHGLLGAQGMGSNSWCTTTHLGLERRSLRRSLLTAHCLLLRQQHRRCEIFLALLERGSQLHAADGFRLPPYQPRKTGSNVHAPLSNCGQVYWRAHTVVWPGGVSVHAYVCSPHGTAATHR